MTTKLSTTVLVICDSNFQNLCDDPEEYVDRLIGVLKKLHGDDVSIKTVTGKYGFSKVTDLFEPLEVEDRNKTVFVQTIENNTGYFDLLLIVSLSNTDPYLEGVADCMFDHSKDIIRYSYKRKS